jgi:hypothetical protein
MFSHGRTLLAAAAFFVACFWNGSVSAATCPSPTIPGNGWVEVSPAGACLAYGYGNINGTSTDPFLTSTAGADYEYITGVGAGGTSGILTITILPDKSGTFSISSMTGYSALALGLKDGNLGGLKWGVLALTALSGVWGLFDASGTAKDLSHASLYGIPCAPGTCITPPPPVGGEVPLPPAAVLFGTALAGVALLGVRRRRPRNSI